MGILSHPKGLALLLQAVDQLESREKSLQLGYMVINARVAHLSVALGSCSDDLKKKFPAACFDKRFAEKIVPNQLIFNTLFSQNDVIDNYLAKNPVSRATIKHDMNYPIDTCHHNQYDFVVDSGTLEHIFNFPQALANVASALKIGGVVYHHLPADGYLEHGLIQLSAESLMGWYRCNGFEVISAFYSTQKERIDYYSDESLDPSNFATIDLLRSDSESIRSYRESYCSNRMQGTVTDVTILSKKIANVGKYEYPQQGQWAKHWEKTSL